MGRLDVASRRGGSAANGGQGAHIACRGPMLTSSIWCTLSFGGGLVLGFLAPAFAAVSPIRLPALLPLLLTDRGLVSEADSEVEESAWSPDRWISRDVASSRHEIHTERRMSAHCATVPGLLACSQKGENSGDVWMPPMARK